MIHSFMKESKVSYIVAKQVLCADLASDRKELQIFDLLELKKNKKSIYEVLNTEEVFLYMRLMKGLEVDIKSLVE